MKLSRKIELLEAELECVRRQAVENPCDRNCADCDILQNTDELITMYSETIAVLKYIENGGALGKERV